MSPRCGNPGGNHAAGPEKEKTAMTNAKTRRAALAAALAAIGLGSFANIEDASAQRRVRGPDADYDNDGKNNRIDRDDDNDGRPDRRDRDDDNDGRPDVRDRDDDNDGLRDRF